MIDEQKRAILREVMALTGVGRRVDPSVGEFTLKDMGDRHGLSYSCVARIMDRLAAGGRAAERAGTVDNGRHVKVFSIPGVTDPGEAMDLAFEMSETATPMLEGEFTVAAFAAENDLGRCSASDHLMLLVGRGKLEGRKARLPSGRVGWVFRLKEEAPER